MVRQWKRVWEARKWMKQNEGFLPTWHAYLGYRLNFFDELQQSGTVGAHVKDRELLENWVQTGLILGHLKKKGDKVVPSSQMKQYFTKSSDVAIGDLLVEMMELHIPSLMDYAPVLKGDAPRRSFDGDEHGTAVATTSSFIEQISYRAVKKVVSEIGCETILDIGCGNAGYIRRLAEEFPHKEFVGIDLNKAVVEDAKRNTKGLSNVRIEQQDLREWDNEGKTFSCIMMHNLLHYFSPVERMELMKNIEGLLDKKGGISLITPLYLSEHGQEFSAAFNNFLSVHDNLHRLPTAEDVEVLAAAIGRKVESIKPIVKEGGWYSIVIK